MLDGGFLGLGELAFGALLISLVSDGARAECIVTLLQVIELPHCFAALGGHLESSSIYRTTMALAGRQSQGRGPSKRGMSIQERVVAFRDEPHD
ncbi:hypothetical protein BOSEA31B_20058 [Hyphomicrobiales bacterium]|nr:hypothetical protein BOSEA31B_20058 [Hyphomicrobiales bacterium]CAH1702569.1 hypothetical protein BOSEA1005_30441 [Hyphomicrobiales bacterium]CAI0346772.1 hypothetical protein BO1005MUT1_520284 [Hyphomicrobiales bacterium]